MKILNLAIENTKRVKAVALEPAENGLTVMPGATRTLEEYEAYARALLDAQDERDQAEGRLRSATAAYIRARMDRMGVITSRPPGGGTKEGAPWTPVRAIVSCCLTPA